MPVPCTSNADCKGSCKQHGPGGSMTCHTASNCGETPKCKDDEFCNKDQKCEQKKDECGTNNDCKMLDQEKPVCKVVGDTNKCVGPEDCKAQCSDEQICSEDEKCTTPGEKNICRNSGRSSPYHHRLIVN